MGSRREKFIIVSCAILYVLSATDGILTLWGLSLEAIQEVNPLMQLIINKSPVGFMALKLSVPIILGFVLWKIKTKIYLLLGLVLVMN